MSTELTVLSNQTQLAAPTGGLGISSKLFAKLKPATVNINQPNSQLEGAKKGHLRITETGDQFENMRVTLLVEPVEQRSFYIGEAGQLNRTPDNLMCFSRDMVFPDAKAKQPQAMKCAACPRQDWGPWRKYKEQNKGLTDKSLIPPCDAYYYALFIDTQLKMPLQMYIRSKGKDSFETGLENLVRKLAIMKASGKNPNIFDVSFTLGTKKIETGKFVSYIPVLADFKEITPEEKEEFGNIFLAYSSRGQQSTAEQAEAEAQAQSEAADESINAAVSLGPVDGEYINGDGTVTI